MTNNPTLKRFVDNQSDEVYDIALQEIRNSEKEAKEGKTISNNYREAVKWFSRAANQEEPDSLFHLAICYSEGLGVEKDFPTAVKFLFASADRGR